MKSILAIKPIGWVRLSETPVYHADYIGSQRLTGVPLPSTIAGMLGAAYGLTLLEDEVRRDPLLGLGVLYKRLAEICGIRDEALLMGPIYYIQNASNPHYSIMTYSKEAPLLIHLEALKGVNPKEGLLGIGKEQIIGKIAFESQLGIALGGSKTVTRTFRRGFTYIKGYVKGAETGSLEYQILYYTPCKIERTIVRFVGEGRYATIMTRNPSMAEDLIRQNMATPENAKPGYYVTLSPWPILKSGVRGDPYIKMGEEPSLTPIEEILGVIHVTGESQGGKLVGSSKIYVINIGLGYSEVVRVRRPRVPALPPGTIVKIGDIKGHSILDSILWRLGYATLLRIPLGG